MDGSILPKANNPTNIPPSNNNMTTDICERILLIQ